FTHSTAFTLLSPLFFHSSLPHPALHSFPTRRSSDLSHADDVVRLGQRRPDPNLADRYPLAPLDRLLQPRLVLGEALDQPAQQTLDRKGTRLNSSHDQISYAVFCLKKKKKKSKVKKK